MAVEIIDSFRLGTDFPLDSRYVVESINDVSAYWYPGMQVYQTPFKKIYSFDGSVWTTVIDSSVLEGNLIILDSSISDLRQKDSFIDASLAFMDSWNNSQDSSIFALREKDGFIDTSLNNIWTKFGYVDSSISTLNQWNIWQDISIQSLDNLKVNRAGDTMTGPLIINSTLDVSSHALFSSDISILGDLCVKQTVHIDSKIHFHPYLNSNASDGDLWIDPSTYNLMFKHPILDASGIDASSYDLTNRLLRTEDDWSKFPDSSVLIEGDRILIEQAGSGFKKAWISSSAFAQSIGVLSFAAYDASLSISSTTATAYQRKLLLTTDASAKAGIFRIGWTLQLTNSNNAKNSRYRVRVEDTSTILDEDSIAFPSGESYLTYAGFQHIYLPDGSHNISVDFAAVTNTARIKSVRLEYQAAQAQVV